MEDWKKGQDLSARIGKMAQILAEMDKRGIEASNHNVGIFATAIRDSAMSHVQSFFADTEKMDGLLATVPFKGKQVSRSESEMTALRESMKAEILAGLIAEGKIPAESLATVPAETVPSDPANPPASEQNQENRDGTPEVAQSPANRNRRIGAGK